LPDHDDGTLPKLSKVDTEEPAGASRKAYPGRRLFRQNDADPEHEMLRIIQDNAEAVAGTRPAPVVGLGGTDCRFWRAKGVPAFVYGCLPDRMGAPDERVPVEEFLDVVRVHTLSAYDYLAASA